MTHIVRVAAQNLSASVFDTNDLSTIRGGSLALLAAVEQLDRGLPSLVAPASYETVFVGASELLGIVTLPDALSADDVQARVRNELAQIAGGARGVSGRHLDFGVAVEIAPRGDTARAAAVAEARLRTSQYRSLSFPLPERAQAARRPCALDRARPAVDEDHGDLVSASVKARRSFGRRARQAFYDKELRRDPIGVPIADELARRGLEFSRSLTDLRTDSLDLPPALSGKIALIHLDGNDFQARRLKLMGKLGELAAFSRFVRTRQTQLLARLVAWALKRSHMVCPPDPDDNDQCERLRFETLLWGGDEMAFAVPAWAAWDLVLEIEDELHAWLLPASDLSSLSAGDRKLTHAIGLAYGHHKTPIRQFRALAEELCADAKDADKSRTIVSVFVAESVDLPRGGVSTARHGLMLGGQGKCCFALAKPGVERPFQSATRWFETLSEALERSQAMKLALKAREWAGGLLAAHKGSGEETWAGFARVEIARVVRGKVKAEALQCLGLAEDKGRVPLVPNDFAALPLLVALHLWEFIQPFGPGCRDAGEAQDR